MGLAGFYREEINKRIENIMIIGQLIQSVKRNHGLEHATIHVLSKRFPRKSFAGHSDTGGFWLKGEVTAEELSSAVIEALSRLNAGEHSLAIHPNCGTNLLTSGFMASLGVLISLIGVGNKPKDKLNRFPLMVALASFGLIYALPLGPKLQKKYTTTGKMGDLKIVDLRISQIAGKITHRVRTIQNYD